MRCGGSRTPGQGRYLQGLPFVAFMDTDTRTAFGQAYKRWMLLNSFSQQMPHDWAKASGGEGPWNSQLSLLTQNPCRLDPKAGFWLALGRFNAAIAAQEFPPSITRTLRDKLKAAKPFLHDDGELVSAGEFFQMFIGELAIPEVYAVAPRTYTEDDVAGINDMCRAAFRKIAEDQFLSPKEAWDRLKPLCKGMNATQIDKFRSVLSGWDSWTVDEINTLTPVGDALGLPAQALDRLGEGLLVSI